MALPKLDIPTYTLELPSTGEEIKYRPFLVKEQKTLMILQEGDEKKNIYDAISRLIDDCTFNSLNVKKLPVFDFEYVFLKIRCKSVGATTEVNLLCPDDYETRVPVTINLDEIDVQVQEEHTNTIPVTDKISMILRWPTIDDLSDLVGDDNSLVKDVMALLDKCVEEIIDSDTIHKRGDFSKKELDEFIDSLPTETFKYVGDFFETMPKLLHVVNVKNPKTKVESEVTIEGIDSFF